MCARIDFQADDRADSAKFDGGNIVEKVWKKVLEDQRVERIAEIGFAVVFKSHVVRFLSDNRAVSSMVFRSKTCQLHGPAAMGVFFAYSV